jgi:S1-C subfamily serine protease
MNRMTIAVASLALSSALSAQVKPVEPPVKVRVPEIIRTYSSASTTTRLGFGTSSNASSRDTLGILVTSVEPGSSADKAGLEEGNRIAAINGVNLKLSASDVGEPDMSGIMNRRMQRELAKLKTGDDVELRVWASGQMKTVHVHADERAQQLPGRNVVAKNDNRASIGATIGGTSSPRDTLGVFVASVVEGGPLAKAGIFEGSRIATVNGVDLRVASADVGDAEIATSRVNRLLREIEKLAPAAKVELRVWTNGQYRTVTVDAARWQDVYKDDGGPQFMFSGDGSGTLDLRMLDQLGGQIGDRFRSLQIGPLDMPGLMNGTPRVRIEEPTLDPRMSPDERDRVRAALGDQVTELRQRLDETMQRARFRYDPAVRM